MNMTNYAETNVVNIFEIKRRVSNNRSCVYIVYRRSIPKSPLYTVKQDVAI
jgi:hypothetical protein